MPKRIFLRKNGISNTQAPEGYEVVGLGENGLIRVDSDGSKISVNGDRVDVISFSVDAGNDSSAVLSSKGFLSDSASENKWLDFGKNLLWKIFDTDSIPLGTDLQFSTGVQFKTYLNNFTITDSKTIVVKGYYYKNQSREKFRIVGRNYAYWSLAGLGNYARLKGRQISPTTSGQSIIDHLNSEFGVGTQSGEGLLFTTNKNLYVHKRKSQLDTSSWISNVKTWTYRWGITPLGDYLPLSGGSQSVLSSSPLSQNYAQNCRIIGLDRNSNIFDDGYGVLTNENASWLLINKLDIRTEDYSPSNIPPNPLVAYCVRPMGQDTFLLSHNAEIQNDDSVFLISDSLKGTPIIQEITPNDYLDLNNFGDDISTGLGKAQKNRFGSIWLGDIGKGMGRIKNISISSQSERKDGGISATSYTTKWRVAWGKNGVYTVSDDYIWIKGNGFITTAYVNRQI